MDLDKRRGGVKGMYWVSSLLPLRVGTSRANDSAVGGSRLGVVERIERALIHNHRCILSNSCLFGPRQFYRDEFDIETCSTFCLAGGPGDTQS